MSDVTATDPSYKKTAIREAAVFFGFLLFGLLLLPFAVYLVGETIFGDYGGAGFADLYGRLLKEIRGGNAVAWFLVLSPYLVWQTVRLTIRQFRRTGNR